jgi:protocatechuate 3,4-dioxygenase beta subunit
LIDGSERITSNESGIYKLDEITPGHYFLEGVAAHYFFETLNFEVKPSVKQLPNLIATDYHLCGKVKVENDDGAQFSANNRPIVLTEKSKNIERRTPTNGSGEFCFEVKPGEYSLYPEVTK